MSTEPGPSGHVAEPRAASEHSADLLTDGESEELADLEEDRRRQRDLDDGELGGEA